MPCRSARRSATQRVPVVPRRVALDLEREVASGLPERLRPRADVSVHATRCAVLVTCQRAEVDGA